MFHYSRVPFVAFGSQLTGARRDAQATPATQEYGPSPTPRGGLKGPMGTFR